MEKDRLVQSVVHQQEAVEAGLPFIGRSQVYVIGGESVSSLFSYFFLQISSGVDLGIR